MIPKLLLRHGQLECGEGRRLLNRRRERVPGGRADIQRGRQKNRLPGTWEVNRIAVAQGTR